MQTGLSLWAPSNRKQRPAQLRRRVHLCGESEGERGGGSLLSSGAWARTWQKGSRLSQADSQVRVGPAVAQHAGNKVGEVAHQRPQDFLRSYWGHPLKNVLKILQYSLKGIEDLLMVWAMQALFIGKWNLAINVQCWKIQLNDNCVILYDPYSTCLVELD